MASIECLSDERACHTFSIILFCSRLSSFPSLLITSWYTRWFSSCETGSSLIDSSVSSDVPVSAFFSLRGNSSKPNRLNILLCDKVFSSFFRKSSILSLYSPSSCFKKQNNWFAPLSSLMRLICDEVPPQREVKNHKNSINNFPSLFACFLISSISLNFSNNTLSSLASSSAL